MGLQTIMKLLIYMWNGNGTTDHDPLYCDAYICNSCQLFISVQNKKAHCCDVSYTCNYII